ncbi:MAG: DUF418 domain-containing protein [Bacteroides sp.]|nr:DUF418 domain-containing protein [Bacteroides sp.]
MITQTPAKKNHIDLVDALRGFALLGIILIHHVEHFDIANQVISSSGWLRTLDHYTEQVVFFAFGGKCYAIFALLFGFSFYAQYESRKRKGEDLAGRFVWRMCILFGLGIFHVMFYSGAILSCYALVGLLLVPIRKLSDKTFLILATLCMLEPWELGQLIYGLFNTNYTPVNYTGAFYRAYVEAATQSPSFGELIKTNVTAGLINSHLFAWSSGRYFQTLSLFMIGIVLGRRSLFIPSSISLSFWKKIWILSIPAFLLLWWLKATLPDFNLRSGIHAPLGTMIHMWGNFAFMSFLVASFALLWFKTGFRKTEELLIPYGRMSLTNYITCSIAGSVIYYKTVWECLIRSVPPEAC